MEGDGVGDRSAADKCQEPKHQTTRRTGIVHPVPGAPSQYPAPAMQMGRPGLAPRQARSYHATWSAPSTALDQGPVRLHPYRPPLQARLELLFYRIARRGKGVKSVEGAGRGVAAWVAGR